MTTDVEQVPEVTQELPANGAITEEQASPPAAEPEVSETQAPPAPRSGTELQQALDAGEPLTNAEKAALREHQRAEDNRARAVQFAREQQRQNAERIKNLREQFPDRLTSKAQAEIEAAINEGRAISPTLLKSYLKDEADTLFNNIEPVVLASREANIKGMIYRATAEAGGNAQGILQYMDDNGYSFDQMVELHGQLMQEIGKKTAPDAQEAAKLRTENATLKAEVERLTAERGNGSPSAAGRERQGDSRSEDEILLDPMTPIDTINSILARRRG